MQQSIQFAVLVLYSRSGVVSIQAARQSASKAQPYAHADRPKRKVHQGRPHHAQQPPVSLKHTAKTALFSDASSRTRPGFPFSS